MIKKLYYMNDEQRNMTVRILDDRYDGATGTGDVYLNLQPAEARLLEIHAPAGHVLYVKKWRDMVMISHIDPSVLALLSQSPPPEDAA